MPLLAFALLTLICGCDGKKASPASPRTLEREQVPVLRVTATLQYPDVRRPWLKKPPFVRCGLGTVLEDGNILVTAEMAAHATDITLEKPEDGPKVGATIAAIDEECNLALLRPTDPSFLKGTATTRPAQEIRAGDVLRILQLEPNGSPAFSPATVTTMAVMPYPADGASYLLCRVTATIPQRDGSFVLPAFLDGALAGLVMRHDPKTQAAEIIPAPVIGRFLSACTQAGYSGLGRAGLSWEQMRGAALKAWLCLPEGKTGVYVTSVIPGGPAEKAGLKKGDILTEIDGKPIDGEGCYQDPVLGKVTFSHAASVLHGPGDRMGIGYFRSSGEGTGTFGSATVTLSGRISGSEVSPLRLEGDMVPYLFLGGLLFQELSRPYLKEWGANWQNEAPEELVAIDAYPKENGHQKGRVVILSAVLPSRQTIGLRKLDNRVVTSVNGKPVHGLGNLREALRHPSGGFHRFDLADGAGPVFLDLATLAADQEELCRSYGIPNQGSQAQGIPTDARTAGAGTASP